MNKAKLMKDSLGNIYLQVTGKPLDKPVYFRVELFATELSDEFIKLRLLNLTEREMIVDLSDKK